jgi:ABC-2 type transport system permease protein
LADLVQLPGVMEQVKLIAAVRWRILKNGLRRKNSRWDLIGMIFAGISSGALVIGLCVAFYFGAYEFLLTNRAGWYALLYWGIFIWWQVLPIFVAGFGSTFEFATLLRFPLNLRAFYLLGLGYGLADFGAVAGILWILSMLAGAAIARPSVLPLLILISFLFVMLNVTLERLVGSWLEKVLAKRKTRELFFGLFILSMVSLNFLNPILQRYGRSARPKLLQVLPYISWLPGSLAGQAVGGAANGIYFGVLVGTLGLFAWLLVTSLFLWRRFAAQYAGEELSEGPAPSAARKKERKTIVTREGSHLLSPQVTAVALKEFRYLTRNGFAFLTLLLPPIMVLFFTMQFGRGSIMKEHALGAATFFPGMMGYLILILVSPAYNAFAFEGKGIQTYYMAPVEFRNVFLGKNLFLVSLVAFELTIALSFLLWRIGWPGTPLFIATVAGAAFAVTGQLAIANWSSLSFPKKMEIGKMKGQRNSGVAVWTALGVQVVLGGICALLLLAGRWTGNLWLPAVAFVALTAAALGGYFASLSGMNRLAEDKKELLIETLCR